MSDKLREALERIEKWGTELQDPKHPKFDPICGQHILACAVMIREALAGAASVGASEAEIRLDEAMWWNSLYVGPNCLSWFDQRGVRMAELTARALGATSKPAGEP